MLGSVVNQTPSKVPQGATQTDGLWNDTIGGTIPLVSLLAAQLWFDGSTRHVRLEQLQQLPERWGRHPACTLLATWTHFIKDAVDRAPSPLPCRNPIWLIIVSVVAVIIKSKKLRCCCH